MKRMQYFGIGILLVLLTGMFSCQPLDGDELTLSSPAGTPVFSFAFVQGDSNRVVVTDKTGGTFDRLWVTPGGQPDKSEKVQDTIFFPKAGTYTLSLYASFNGGGVSSSKSVITIQKDAQTGCSDLVELLVGSCNKGARKCWTFSKAAGAVGVGPIPGSVEWYKSPLNGLQGEQYDDSFCFSLDGGVFNYENNGLTVDPWNGYVPVPYNPPKNQTWTLDPKGGLEGVPRLTLTEGAFLGIWDASNVYDIVSIKANEMVVRTPFLKGDGWFQLTFVAK